MMDSPPLSSSVWVSLGFQSRCSLIKISGERSGVATQLETVQNVRSGGTGGLAKVVQ